MTDEINELNPQDSSPTLPDEGGESGGAVAEDTSSEITAAPTEKQKENATDRLATLEKELEDYKKRFAGSTRSWQQERTEKEQLRNEINSLKQYLGVTEEDVGGQQPTQQNQQAMLVQQQMVNRMSALELQVLESDFATKNPNKAFVFKDPLLKQIAEAKGFEAYRKEIMENGRAYSQPQDFLRIGVEAAVSHYNSIKEEGVKSATEKRKQIKESGVELGGSKETKKSGVDDEDEYDPRADFIRSKETHQRQFRYGQ
jgi:hypothetical protein